MAEVNESISILMVAGEPSGDLHAAGVVQHLRELEPRVHIFGIGGDRMREAGQEQLYTTRQMAVIGFTEVIKHLPFFWKVFRRLEFECRRRKPACAILVDYPGFNLRLARRLKRLGVPVLYYIAPQVWAWGANRIPKMARWIDHMAVVFPFEVSLFENAGIPTTFVGHPLLEGLAPEVSESEFRRQHGLVDAPILGLLPGSRKQEVETLLPDMLRAAAILKKRDESLRVLVSRAAGVPHPLYKELVQSLLPEALIVANQTYSLMRYSQACLVASGTATLETACFATPMVIVYRVSELSYRIGRRLVRLDCIGLANIVAGERVVPELIQHDFTPARAAEALRRLLYDAAHAEAIRRKLRTVREKLGEPGASRKVAELALSLTWQKVH